MFARMDIIALQIYEVAVFLYHVRASSPRIGGEISQAAGRAIPTGCFLVSYSDYNPLAAEGRSVIKSVRLVPGFAWRSAPGGLRPGSRVVYDTW